MFEMNQSVTSNANNRSPETVLVNIAGRNPGDIVDVHASDGRRFQIIIPDQSSAPGAQHLYVDIPTDRDSGIIEVGVSNEKKSMTVIGGAAVAAGVAGSLLLGPLVGLAAAGAAAYATTRDDNVGEAARATGSATATAGEIAYEKAKMVGGKMKEFDQQHDVTGKASRALASAATSLENAMKSATSSSNSSSSSSSSSAPTRL